MRRAARPCAAWRAAAAQVRPPAALRAWRQRHGRDRGGVGRAQEASRISCHEARHRRAPGSGTLLARVNRVHIAAQLDQLVFAGRDPRSKPSCRASISVRRRSAWSSRARWSGSEPICWRTSPRPPATAWRKSLICPRRWPAAPPAGAGCPPRGWRSPRTSRSVRSAARQPARLHQAARLNFPDDRARGIGRHCLAHGGTFHLTDAAVPMTRLFARPRPCHAGVRRWNGAAGVERALSGNLLPIGAAPADAERLCRAPSWAEGRAMPSAPCRHELCPREGRWALRDHRGRHGPART